MTKKQPNLKLDIGIQYTIIKQATDYEDQDPEEINLRNVGAPQTMNARTKPLNVYNVASVKPIFLSLKAELEREFWSGMDGQVGSNWAIHRITNLFANKHTHPKGSKRLIISTHTRTIRSPEMRINQHKEHRPEVLSMLYVIPPITTGTDIAQNNSLR
jgi:hypothetical protein